ncbi:RNA-guided endonuclease InsQ/TnpB family protein [Paenibacillus larvae]|uniref:Transposase, IS605 OrfB family n=1 Tax=Paenibacillus larvae subsp. larvae TaxID=147375 RepID=A0A2L1U7D9_9BACL|nr:RNA-guided endonuclease TnpB family protein [Paenibacillus larvae]AVF28847.1 transposase, IS605 OrfB family [Paenibacillus larvae subsp. larvae]MCY9500307.1 transposase [Paenibacillus larvae]MDR5608743.1 transposase [Paenibacillus larvae]
MYLTVKQQVKQLSKEDYQNVKKLSHIAKNLANEAIYNVRQYYFQEGEYLNYEKNYVLLKDSPNYKMLNSNMAQQILKEVDGSFKSFFGLLKLAKKGKYSYKDINLPKYLPKDGFTTLVIGFVRLNGNQLTIPYSNQYRKKHKSVTITIPPILQEKKIKEIRIIPKAKARFFEIQYTYEVKEEQRNLNKNKALAIDLGINNLATCVTSTGESFIVDGRRLKSINQWYNKRNAQLQSIKDLQKYEKKNTNRQKANTRNRNNKVNDYMAKTARIIINYCLENDIGNLVCGYNETFQRGSNIGKANNQTFVHIPFGKLRDKLEYLCKIYGIRFVKQEESYTSKASFFDKDIIPTYNDDNPTDISFSGKRVKRGLYQTKNGKILNADVNGALNILKKSSVVSLTALYGRGELDTPVRIKIA